MTNRLMVATPVRAANLQTAQVSLGYAEFRERLSRALPSYAGSMVFALDTVRARNRAVGLLLSQPQFKDITHILWVDDDQWCEDITIVAEMMALCNGILGAPYTNKRHPTRWVHQPDGKGGVAGVGFGFTMVPTAVIKQMAYQLTTEWYTDAPHALRCPNLFGQVMVQMSPESPDRTLLSEDFSFCWRARQLGIPVQIYPGAGLIYHAGGHPYSARDIPGGVVDSPLDDKLPPQT